MDVDKYLAKVEIKKEIKSKASDIAVSLEGDFQKKIWSVRLILLPLRSIKQEE